MILSVHIFDFWFRTYLPWENLKFESMTFVIFCLQKFEIVFLTFRTFFVMNSVCFGRVLTKKGKTQQTFSCSTPRIVNICRYEKRLTRKDSAKNSDKEWLHSLMTADFRVK